jgi:hypothetical protein
LPTGVFEEFATLHCVSEPNVKLPPRTSGAIPR